MLICAALQLLTCMCICSTAIHLISSSMLTSHWTQMLEFLHCLARLAVQRGRIPVKSDFHVMAPSPAFHAGWSNYIYLLKCSFLFHPRS